MTEVRDSILRRTIKELLYTIKTKEKIIDSIVDDTYFSKTEAKLIYIEALEKILEILREIRKKEHEKEKQKRKHN